MQIENDCYQKTITEPVAIGPRLILSTRVSEATSGGVMHTAYVSMSPSARAVIFLGLMILAGWLLSNQTVHSIISRITSVVLPRLKYVVAQSVRLYDRIIPLNRQNGRPSRLGIFLWSATNVLCIVGWFVFRSYPITSIEFGVAASVVVILLLFNLLLLLGCYFALKEETEVMNGELGYFRHVYDDLSTIKNMRTVCVAALLFFIYLAAIIDMRQIAAKEELITVKASVGSAFVDTIIATLNAVPIVSQLGTLSGLGDNYNFVSGAGNTLKQLINTAASFLVIGGILAFVTRHLAVKRLVESIVSNPEIALENDPVKRTVRPPIERLRWERFLRGPAVVKRRCSTRYLHCDGTCKTFLQLSSAFYQKLRILKRRCTSTRGRVDL